MSAPITAAGDSHLSSSSPLSYPGARRDVSHTFPFILGRFRPFSDVLSLRRHPPRRETQPHPVVELAATGLVRGGAAPGGGRRSLSTDIPRVREFELETNTTSDHQKKPLLKRSAFCTSCVSADPKHSNRPLRVREAAGNVNDTVYKLR